MIGFYLPGLNGFRAVAATIVLITHTLQYVGINILNTAAYFGVTIFFTLSGFLITLLSLKEKEESGKISVWFFYVRRFLRIWPLYFVFIILTVGLFQFIPSQPFSTNQISNYLLFIPNYSTAYYQEIVFLSHYWSLGVEEQFYFFWPVLVSLFAIRFLRFAIIFTVVFLCIKVFIFYYAGASSSAYNLISITRFGCMSIGGIGAYLFKMKSSCLNPLKNKVAVIISWVVLIFFLTGFWKDALIIQHEIAALVVMVLILDQLNKPKILSLEKKMLYYIGKISFGIYVFHPLVLILFTRSIGFDNTKTSPVTVAILSLILVPLITFLVSHLSYKYFESPFLKLKNNFQIIKT